MGNQLYLNSIGISPLFLNRLKLLQQLRVRASHCYLIATSHCSRIDHLVSGPIKFYSNIFITLS